MNLYAHVILWTMIVSFFLDLTAKWMNLGRLTGSIPPGFDDILDEATYRKGQEYTRFKTKFHLVTGAIQLAIVLAFWFGGGFNRVDQWVSLWGWHDIGTGLAFVGVLLALQFVLGLPFRIYSTFNIESRFGFNRTTPGTFVSDILKGLLLAVILGGILFSGVLAFFRYFDQWGWFYAWVGTVLFTLVVQYVAPTWIMPLFNRYEPVTDESLKTKILDYTRSVDYPVSEIFMIDGSRRSTKGNAFFTGFGRRKRIALFDTLIEKHTPDELLAVVAHEVGHFKKKHIVKRMILSILQTGIMFYLLSIFLKEEGLFAAFYMENVSVHAGLVFFAMLYRPVDLLMGILFQFLSRRDEYEADRFAAETTGDSNIMIQALKKLSVDNLSNLTPHPFYVFLNYDHPPVKDRIRALARISHHSFS